MLSKVVLLLDKRRELSTKYKKLLEQNSAKVFVSDTIERAFELLCEYEPDLVLISDSLEATLSETCKKLRMLGYSSRPVIVALSKSEDINDKLSALDAGADDFLSEPIDPEEFKARINAHLRRHIENSLDEITNLPDSKISFRVLKRTIVENRNWAAMLIKINNFEQYLEIYGELAADKMRQTFSAIVASTLDENDFIGELVDGEFLVITNYLKAEHIANFVIYAFNTIVEKFYTENDVKQGYIILKGDENEGKRVELASTSIGVISNELKTYNSLKNALNSLIAANKLAKLKPGSSYTIDHPEISAADSVEKREYNNRLMIIERDDALNLLLQTTAQMQGYDAAIGIKPTIKSLLNFRPAVLILDAGDTKNLDGIEFCKKIRTIDELKDLKIILSTIVHDKKLILDAGADLYLPKPYELVNIFSWVERLISEYNES